MPEGRRTVLLKEKVANPGEAVAGQRQGQQQQPGAFADGQGEDQYHQAGADKLQPAAGAVAVLAEVVRVELGEAVEMSYVFHDCILCGLGAVDWMFRGDLI
ncbi:hypothetical protein D3C84_937040 [compost metagenome]